MVKGVIFDVDGVLLNSMPVWENLGELYLQKFGIQAEKDLSEILYEMSLKEAAEYLISHYGLKQTVEEVTKGIVKEVEQFYVEKVPLHSSGDRKNADAALKRLKVFSYFEGIFTASEIGSGKNQPDLYFAAALQLDTDPGQTWVFEDAWHAIRTAKSAGFKTVAVYDKANDKNLGQIWNHADIYLPDLLNFNEFWSRASEM